MRWKQGTGSLVFYMPKGQARRGLKTCDKAIELRALVEEVFAMSIELPVEEF